MLIVALSAKTFFECSKELTIDPYPKPNENPHEERAGKKLKIKHYIRKYKADNFSVSDIYTI
jgi:hypothetical protein